MKKGFTLVEIIGVVTLLGIIALITYPSIDKAMKNSKQRAYLEQVKRIEDAADRYVIENREIIPDIGNNTVTKISIEELLTQGYIQKTEIDKVYNPLDKSEMQGCVLIQYDESNHQYLYKYSESCTG